MLTRGEVVAGLTQELEDFAALVRSLDRIEWARPTRCDGWTVADVAGHLVGAFADIIAGRVEGQGTAEVSERQAAERRGRSPSEIADEMDRVRRHVAKMLAAFDDELWSLPAAGGYTMTLGQAMEALWTGTYVHADDIRAAVGRPSERGPGLRGALHHVAGVLETKGWGPAMLDLDGLDEIAVGRGEPLAAAEPVTGDPLGFLLVATGRADPEPWGLGATVNIYDEVAS